LLGFFDERVNDPAIERESYRLGIEFKVLLHGHADSEQTLRIDFLRFYRAEPFARVVDRFLRHIVGRNDAAGDLGHLALGEQLSGRRIAGSGGRYGANANELT
jgi:hypothetical protein